MRQLIVFLSSTVDDLKHVRDEIDEALTHFGMQVWRSDKHNFPVKKGLSSHEACLDAVRNSDVLVTLIGTRYGAPSDADGKSITWCEYEAARGAGVYPVVLIREDVNELASKVSERRAALKRRSKGITEAELDKKLLKLFPDVKPYVQNLPAQERFIDAVRMGHADNWVEMKWTGTTGHAVQYIISKLTHLLISLKEEAALSAEAGDAQRLLLDLFASLHDEIVAGRSIQSALDRVLESCVEDKDVLFGFRPDDRYNFMLYRLDGDTLVPVARRSHPDIPVKNRSWKVGEAHVGKAIGQATPLVTPYLPGIFWTTTADSAQDESDRRNYVSAVSIPLENPDGKPAGVFIVTSSRRDHFHSAAQPEALICASFGRILGVLSRVEAQ